MEVTAAVVRRERTSGLPPVVESVWFGPADRPLAGRLHLPADREVRGAVVLCPAVGVEYALGHPGLRRLAEELAAAGVAALRFDYDGVGDSWGGDTDPDRVGAWRRSVRAAVAWTRALGADAVALAGLRVGALLAAEAADDADAVALALWDPVTGSAYARRLRATARMQGFPTDPGTVAADGIVITDETYAGLQGVDVPPLDPARPTVAVVRPGEPDVLPDGLAVLWPRAGQERLLADTTGMVEVPEQTVADLATWLAARMPATTTVLARTGRQQLVAGGVRETAVVVDGLYGVVSEPADGPLPGAPTVALLTTSLDPHIGPSRGWVEWARELAGLGFRAVRVDLSGAGESPLREGRTAGRAFGPDTVPDVTALVRGLDAGSGVALAGLCSGGRNAVDAAARVAVTDLLLVNPVLQPTRASLEDYVEDDSVEAAEVEAQATSRKQRMSGWVPGWAWRAAYTAGVFRRHGANLDAALRRGAAATIVYGVDDFVLLAPRGHHDATMRRLAGRGRLVVTEVGADHALVGPLSRRRAFAVLTDHLVGRYGGKVDAPRQ